MNMEESITALGALCELAGFIYKQLMANGFPEERAYEVAAEYVLVTLNKPNSEEEE